MNRAYRALPGPGFVILFLACAGSAGFFAWGLARPPLDQAWRLQIRVELGERLLRAGQRQELDEVLARHPDLADAWLEDRAIGIVSPHEHGRVDGGWAYLVQAARHPATVEVTPLGREPVSLRLSRGDEIRRGTARPEEPWRVALPAGEALLIELGVESPGTPPPLRVQAWSAPP